MLPSSARLESRCKQRESKEPEMQITLRRTRIRRSMVPSSCSRANHLSADACSATSSIEEPSRGVAGTPALPHAVDEPAQRINMDYRQNAGAASTDRSCPSKSRS